MISLLEDIDKLNASLISQYGDDYETKYINYLKVIESWGDK